MEKFSKGAYTLHYKVFGAGQPIILLHGFLEDHSMWTPIANELSKENCAVYTLDLPCHGKSRYSEEICSMKGVADLLHTFMTELKLDKPFVFGHSMGGYIGLEVLKLRPIQLTLVHSNFWEDSSEKKKDRNRVVEIVKTNKARLIHEAIPNLFAPENRQECQADLRILMNKAMKIPANEIIACTKGMRDRSNRTDQMENNDVIMIHGEKDPIISTKLLLKQLEVLKKEVEIHSLPKCGHMSFWENPAALIKIVRNIVFR